MTLALGTLMINAFSASMAKMLVAPLACARIILPLSWSIRLGVISMPRCSAREIACLENATSLVCPLRCSSCCSAAWKSPLCRVCCPDRTGSCGAITPPYIRLTIGSFLSYGSVSSALGSSGTVSSGLAPSVSEPSGLSTFGGVSPGLVPSGFSTLGGRVPTARISLRG